MERFVSIVVPVYNEGANIVRFLTELEPVLAHEPHETLIVHDFPEDNTLPAIAAMNPKPQYVRTVHNTLGKGVLNAYRAGFAAAKGDVIVTMVSDRADDPKDVPMMVALVRGGADVACGSRYMKGGKQVGGPFLKQLLSRMAGLSLHYCAGMPTHDSTNNFRAYSRRVISLPIESNASFALGLELVVKAREQGWTITEVPTTWYDRTEGESRFRLWAWLPQYLHWYFRGIKNAWLPWTRKPIAQ